MAEGTEYSVPANLRKLLDDRMKKSGLKPATAHQMLSTIVQETRAKQKIAIRELLEEESNAD
ncbi:MAG: hypothetical protein AABX89_03870 [Candidatus Thermoplasmatota archaeon]